MSRLRAVASGVVLLLATGVTGPRPAFSAVANPVIIDVHTHIFNLRYLPVKGILIARGVPPLVAAVVDRFLVGATQLSNGVAPPEADVAPLGDMTESEAREDVFRRLDAAVATHDQQSLTNSERKALRRFTKDQFARADLPPGGAGDEALVRAAVDKARMDPGEHDSDSYFRFLALLMRDELTIARAFQADYPGVRFAIHHLMDMEKGYDDRPSFANDPQIAKLPSLSQELEGRFVGFLAYDPFRRGDALAPVKQAIESGAALGVKFYPPSGYRATANVIPRRPAFWRRANRAQWRSRYHDLHSGKDLDNLIYPLLDWAVANDVPIFSHCTPNGFEAAPTYGLNSDPRFWEEVLKQPRYRKLRLALGHSGGGDWWFSPTAAPNVPRFDEVALRLARTYENVYLDFGYASEVLDPEREAIFVERLGEAVATGPDGPSAAGKFMYGSDWHMVASLGRRRELLTILERVFSSPRLEDHKAAFFAGNAARYLKLADYSRNPKAQPKVRAYLAALLEEMDGAAPASPR